MTSRPPEPPKGPAGRAPPWARAIVRVMDEAVTIPGTDIKIGLDGLLGLIAPGVGDALLASSGVLLIVYGFVSGVPGAVLFRMALFVALDALCGAIPVVGDLFDFGFKSNRKNVELIERYQRPGATATAKDYAFVVAAVATVVVLMAIPVALTITLLVKIFGSG